MRFAIILLVLLSNFAFSKQTELAGATYFSSSRAKVKHDGDFIEFFLQSSSVCQEKVQEARSLVIGNTDALAQWVNEMRAGYNLDYSVELIDVGRHTDGYNYGINSYGCPGMYFASQQVKITLNKNESDQALKEDLINNFFNELQTSTGKLNSDHLSYEYPTETKILLVQKGIFEKTAELLQLAAKEKAKQKATRDFLAFLGPDYVGSWYLQSVEMSDHDDQFLSMAPSGGQYGNKALPEGEAVLSTIKLEPITVSVAGSFRFYFEPSTHNAVK
jgi:hypothetical protein